MNLMLRQTSEENTQRMPTRFNHLNCPLCGNAQVRTILTGWSDGYDAVQCGRCSLIFAFPMKCDVRMYDCSYDNGGEFAGLSAKPTFVKNKMQVPLGWPYKTLLRFIRNGVMGKDFFEVGCGDAHFLYFLKSKGYNVNGCDVSASARRRAKELFGIDIIQNKFDSSTVADNSLDVIAAFELIEHLERPLEFLKTVYSKLKPGGYLFLSTPNVETKWPFTWKHNKAVLPPFHLTIWTKKSIRLAADAAGLRVIRFIEKPIPFALNLWSNINLCCGYFPSRLYRLSREKKALHCFVFYKNSYELNGYIMKKVRH
jgi:2-polyprenyl-3-methyl-5-hydroxy-6-metoxy-1,4-benzoquinol methylase/ribosomal protein S27E